jgi:hypothetical protein
LDSDDYIKPNHFHEALTFLTKNPESPIFSLGYDVVRPDDTIIYKWKPLQDPVNEKLIEGNFLSCIGVFVQRDVFKENLFNEDRELSGSEDYELWMRLAARYPIRTINISTACLVNHESRSVLTINSSALIKRIALLKQYISNDIKVKEYYINQLSRVVAFLDLYLALHLAIGSHKNLAIKVLGQAVGSYWGVMLNLRFWVVVKKLIIN